MTMKRRETRTSVVLSAGLIEVRADVCCERRGYEHARGGTPAQNPAAKRHVVADLQRQDDAAGGTLTKRLRRVPYPGANVRRHPFVESDLHMRRRSRIDAERVAKHIVWDRARRRKRLLLEGDRRNAVYREGTHVLVFGHVS